MVEELEVGVEEKGSSVEVSGGKHIQSPSEQSIPEQQQQQQKQQLLPPTEYTDDGAYVVGVA